MTLPTIPEAILRRIWQEQSFSHDHLTTADGRKVKILSPGTPNTDAGPDFLNARITIGNTVYRGDVELHIGAEEWLAHRHDRDPHYNKVILHVVLTAEPLSPPARTASKRIIPLLVLHPFLDEKTHEAWARPDDRIVRTQPLACVAVNDDVPASIITRWLEQLGYERVELKVRRYEERMKQLVDESRQIVQEPYPRYYGNPAEIPPPRKDYVRKDFMNKALWEQVIYEGVMEALGYAKNQNPFLRLARSMRLEVLRRYPLEDTHTMMALLFGAASLLPSSSVIREKESLVYVAALKRRWRALRATFAGPTLNEADWLFFRLRPQNFPTARLAAMCFLLPRLFGNDSFRSLITLMKDGALSARQRREQLHALFAFSPDRFWETHYHFTAGPRTTRGRARKNTPPDEEKTTPKATIALGPNRIDDILVNTLVPVLLLYARMFRDATVARNARALFGAIPGLQPNAITTTLERDLLKQKAVFDSALQQQGGIQLYRFFCSPLRCTECAVGIRTPLGAP
jgi:hypothetical protein